MKNFYSKVSSAIMLLATIILSTSIHAQVVCNQFDYYYADIIGTTGNLQTDIYSVEFSGGDANLSPIILDLPYGAHIAFNELNALIYVVAENGDIRTLDPVLGQLGSPVSPPSPMTHITTAAINQDGKLLIGDMVTNTIYQIDLSTDPYGVSVYDDNDNISGGDLTWTNSGLYLAAKPSGYLHTVLPAMTNVLMGTVDNSVTGMTTMAGGDNVVVSALGNSNFNEYEVTGSGVTQVNSYQAMLNGEAFTMANGDMASGCSSYTDMGGCENYQYFYINDNSPDVPTGTVMSGTMVGSNFVLTSLFQSGISGHLAVNKDNGDFYVVRQDRVKTFSSTGTLLNDVTIAGNIGKITAAVWNPVSGMVYIGSQNGNAVYEMNPLDGSNTLFAANLPVYGGDLVLDDANNLYLIKRDNSGLSSLYDITSGTPVFIATVAPSVNGAALTNSGGFVMAEGGGSQNFHLYDINGNSIAVLEAVDNLGNPMTLVDGDMASGCFSGINPGVSSCDYSMYYTRFINQNSSKLYALSINPDNSVSSTLITTLNYGSTSSAVSPGGVLYIPNRFGSGFFTAWDVSTGTQLGGQIAMTTAGGDNIQNVGGATFHNGLLYVTSLDGTIYGLDPTTGVSQIDMPGYTNGSDLVFDETGDLWVISRDAGIFYNVSQGTSFSVDLNDIDGIAVMANGNLAAVNGDLGSTMYEIDQSAGAVTGNTFDLGFTVQYGDLSSACIETNPDDTPGQCYATEVLEYVEGTSHNGGSIALERTDANEALGEPERTDELVFVSLGYGGSLTLAFDGAVPNGPGSDIEVVETTYNNTSCDSYPEFADVYVSLNNIDWTFAKTICRADGFVDISDAGDFDYINYVKIVNNNDLSTTPDAFDVDGVVAIHNCQDIENSDFQEAVSTVTSFPNPTAGQAQIEFVPVTAGLATLQIIDMNGRVVETIFNEGVKAGQNYSVAFDGSDLPNGIYITKLTTSSETAVGKIMIAH